MHLPVTVFLFLAGLVLIIKGGDYFVDAASWIAEASGIPPFIVGATIVSLATTLPELLVSSIAAAEGKVDMAIGNGVGSVTANLGLIMGISLVCIPTEMKRSNFAAKSLLMMAASFTILFCSRPGQLSLPGTALLAVLFALFLAENIHQAGASLSSGTASVSHPSRDGKTIRINVAKFILGAAGIIIGSNLLVDNGSTLAAIIGIPESVIAVTLVSVGTSLPELVTTITAILKKQSSLSIGNIMGANIIDLTLILPVCTLVSGQSLTVSRQAILLDFPFCLGACLIASLPTLLFQRTTRLQGFSLLGLYAVYIVLICSGAAL